MGTIRDGKSNSSFGWSQLDYSVYERLIDMIETTRAEIADLRPRDNIDIQSVVWTVGAYTEADAPDAPKVGEPA